MLRFGWSGLYPRNSRCAWFTVNLTIPAASGYIMATSRIKTKVKKTPPTSGVRHGTRALILKTFEEAESKKLSTATLVEGVRRLSGTKIPEPTIRASLRTLLRQKVLQARRVGREKVYSPATASSASPPKVVTPTASETPPPQPAPVIEPQPYPAPTSPTPALPHKLAVGEALVLHIGDTHVETATNVHGKVVLERHPRSRRTK